MKGKQFAISKSLSATDIKKIRSILGLTQAEFARLVNVSQKTIERWETGDKPITGPIVTLIRLLHEYPQFCANLQIPPKTYPLRLSYMNNDEICTIIDVDEQHRKIQISNFTSHHMFCAFGKEENPTFEQYEEFLESRCFPRTRDKIKLILKELDLPFYEPLMIIEKTGGRMAEDNFWIKIER